ncbi:MAG: hypothetical protein QOD30_952, partial [Actinomycetota bacterium]|nr:hypothetical protein [Actinomycetota bacterium]
MQERLDAEATRRVMDRVHALLRDAVEEHGGTVVKFTGDGVMAVFGVPVLREDDAVRAVRAGAAMQAAFADMAVELGIGLRVGVNTGEVVVADGTDDIVGDPVNVAARLEAAAALGDVLLGSETQRLVRDVLAIEAVEPLVLKGKAEPVAAARLVDGAGREPAAVTPFVGRERDTAALVEAFDDAVAAGSARLVTVLGTPGLGKSRLASELLTALADRAGVIEARFLHDGGSSFGPIADALRGIDIESLALGDDSERVGAILGALLGGTSPGSSEQVFWAIRRLLEAMAAERPLVLLLDDLHWAEPVMLDLVEHLAEWLRGGAVLIVALARPELRDRRPALVEIGGPSSTVVLLSALDSAACRRLALDVLDADEVPELVIARALEVSEGNPLFLRELLRLLVDDGVLVRRSNGWTAAVDVDAIELPATIHAALAARIEQLSQDERTVLQAASVIGRHFARGALTDLVPPAIAARLDEHLAALHRRSLVDPEGTWWIDERLFRFHHVLIRDAAYRRVLKETRAAQHERYADWLAAKAADATAEHDEVLGFHLEQALAYRRELGEPMDAAIVDRAVRHLSSAGRRALDSDDLANAASLLGRALALAPDDAELLRDRCEALVSSGDTRAASDIVASLAAAAGDARAAAIAEVFDAQLAGMRSPDALRDAARRASAAATVLASHGDDIGVAKAESVHAVALAGLGQVAACEAALDRSLAAARRAGDQRRANVVLAIAPRAALWGPSPVARASGRCLDVIRVLRITSWAPQVEAQALRCQAVLEAMRDRPDAARRMLDSARATFTDLGHRLGLLETAMFAGQVELLADQPAAAEAHLREAIAGFDALDARVASAQATALLARALLDLDRLDEAEAIADPALAGDDLKASIGLLGVSAEVLARRGDVEEGLALARRAVALAEPTDALVDHADARLALARVLERAGRTTDAQAELGRARDLYDTKGSVVGVRRTGEVRSLSAPSVASVPAARRARGNEASELVIRILSTVAAGDVAAGAALLAPDYVMDNHILRVQLDKPQHAEMLSMVSGGELDSELIATLGEHHALQRLRLAWGDPPERLDMYFVSSGSHSSGTRHDDLVGL